MNIFHQYTSMSDNFLSKKKGVAAKPLLPSTTSFLGSTLKSKRKILITAAGLLFEILAAPAIRVYWVLWHLNIVIQS